LTGGLPALLPIELSQPETHQPCARNGEDTVSLANERSASLLQAGFRALHVAMSHKDSVFPVSPTVKY
jgi:hypothetical protein